MRRHRAVLSAAATIAVLIVVAVPATLGTSAARATAASAAVKTTRISVVATEYKFKLSAKTAPKGKVIFTVKNKGSLAHDFKIKGKKTRLIAPGSKAKMTVRFRKTGHYKYKCTVPGHAQLGMKGTFKVHH